MSGLGILNLKQPSKKYDPTKLLVEPSAFNKMVMCNKKMRRKRNALARKNIKQERKKTYFETKIQSREEDQYREIALAKQLQAEICKGTDEILVHRIQKLRRRFTRSLRTKDAFNSCASSRYMRDIRRNVTGALASLLVKPQWRNASFFAIVPRDWEIPAQDLHLIDPAQLMEQIRSVFYRQGASKASGWMFIGFDGEFDARKQVWVLHVHGLASSGMIDVVDAVRKLPRYRSSRKSPNSNAKIKGATQKVRRTRKHIKNHARVASYVLKSFWPQRDTFINVFGKEDRQRIKRRLREPQHTQFLLWMDRWTPADLTLLIGLRVTRSGLRVTNKKTNTNKNFKGNSND